MNLLRMRKISLIVSLIFYMLGFTFSNSAKAQEITTDGTTSTTVNSDGNGNFNIGQGDRAGSNLFHSFGDFSVPTNGSAVFNNATDISNIFNRVTGGNISNIDGLIQANGSANLFLINPAGIVFGSNARLDIGGSFLGTTADSILFEDGVFSATDLDNPPLLTINAPIGLNLRDNPEPIVNSSFALNDAGEFVGLEVQPGNNLAFIGGNIDFDSGEVTARGGRVELGGLSSAGTVTIEPNGSLIFPNGVNRANVTFSNAADVDVVSEGGGSIFVNANNIDLIGGEFGASTLRAGISADSTSADAQAGDIIINATGTVSISDSAILSNDTFGIGNAGRIQIASGNAIELTGGSAISNVVRTDAVGNSQGITINANSLSLSEGSSIDTSTFGRGNTGAIEIQTVGETLLNGNSNIFNNVELDAVGNSQGITIDATSFSLTEGSSINAIAFGLGNAGNISIEAAESVALSDSSFVFSQVESNGEGRGGDIAVNTDNLSLTDGSQITAAVFGRGNAGSVTVDAEEITFEGINLENSRPTGIINDVELGATGNAGNIIINTEQLSLIDGATIASDVAGVGDAGRIEINATGSVTISGLTEFAGNEEVSALSRFSRVSSTIIGADVVGNAGNIQINAGSLTLADEGVISSSTFGRGNAGNININVKEAVALNNNGDIFSSIGSTGQADENAVSTIEINAASFTIADAFSSIETSTSGTGDAGNIVLNVDDTVEIVDGRLSSDVFADAIGNAGNIEISSTSVNLSQRAVVDSSTNGQGDAGDIVINATDSVSLSDGSSIFSQVSSNGEGEGGEITLDTADLSLSGGSQITAAVFGRGNAGNVTVDASNITFEGIDSQDSLPTGIINSVEFGATGDAGNIVINTERLSLIDGSRIGSDVSGTGNAGNIQINAADSVTISGLTEFAGNEEVSATTRFSQISSTTGTDVVGNAGNIQINAGSLTLADEGVISSSTFGRGNAGNISIDVEEAVALNNNGDIFSSIGFTAQADENAASTIEINAGSFTIADAFSSIETSTSGTGNAGNIVLNVDETVEIVGGLLSSDVATGAIGNAGNVEIASASVNLSEGATINSSTNGQGNAGNIAINATDSVSSLDASSIFSQVNQSGEGEGGEITVDTANLSLTNGSQITAAVFGQGNAGSVTIDASNITFQGIDSDGFAAGIVNSVEAGATGNAGAIEINTDSLNLGDRALLNSTTNGQGNAGDIAVDATDSVSLSDTSSIFSQVNRSGEGEGGEITVDTANLSLTNGSQITAAVFGQGDAGSVTVNASNISFQGIDSDGFAAGIVNSVEAGATGNAGAIEINTDSLNLGDRAVLNSTTNGQGNAGNININSNSSIVLDGAAIVSSNVGQAAVGSGGEINIQTQNFTLLSGSEIITQTFGDGQAGNITVNAADSVSISGTATFPFLESGSPGGFSSGLVASTESGANARGGEITVTTPRLELNNGGVIGARSRSEFAGGEITVNADNLEINSGGQILTTAFSGGASGNINLNVDNLTVEGRDETFSARVEALTTELDTEQANFIIDPVNEFSGVFANTAPDATGNGGVITVVAEDLELDNGGQILAETNFRQPDNITPSEINLFIDDTLTLRNNSTISAQAANSANGGNININAENGFVVAFPSTGIGNDIRANASEQGTGGEINISAEQIFGFSEARNTAGVDNNSNDIDASSDDSTLDGTIVINNSDINPTRGATELPVNTVEPDNNVAQACSYDRNTGVANTFVINGKGGVPPVPTAPLSSELLTFDTQPTASQPKTIVTSKGNIIPAMGVVKTKDGQIKLVATPTDNASRLPNGSPNCG